MTGSSRLASTNAHNARAPYSAPQSVPTTSAQSSAYQASSADSLRALSPFVPREFRASVESHVTPVPVAERGNSRTPARALTPVLGTPVAGTITGGTPAISQLFRDDSAASDFASFIESREADAPDSVADLPWIDAFAADDVVANHIDVEPAVEEVDARVNAPADETAADADEQWPLGEAGKRLDELTQSLSSLDASRERNESANINGEAKAESALPMWNEEEWIDIMPPSSHVDDVAVNSVEAQPVRSSSASSATRNAESAARALEGLAHRVRAGEVQVPVFPTELAEEAVLAGLLASMLGWRQ